MYCKFNLMFVWINVAFLKEAMVRAIDIRVQLRPCYFVGQTRPKIETFNDTQATVVQKVVAKILPTAQQDKAVQDCESEFQLYATSLRSPLYVNKSPYMQNFSTQCY